MKNRCAYCHGKFGLVRHRRAFKSFCSRKCVDHCKAWLRAEVGKRKGLVGLSSVGQFERCPLRAAPIGGSAPRLRFSAALRARLVHSRPGCNGLLERAAPALPLFPPPRRPRRGGGIPQTFG
jgi:hypothetical protein